jgi:hypothetical protein
MIGQVAVSRFANFVENAKWIARKGARHAGKRSRSANGGELLNQKILTSSFIETARHSTVTLRLGVNMVGSRGRCQSSQRANQARVSDGPAW